MAEPVRSCAVCRGRAPKSKLLRVAFRKGLFEADPAQVLPGRGTYLHRTAACLCGKKLNERLNQALRLKGASGDLGPNLQKLIMESASTDAASVVRNKKVRL